ncbi:MAG: carbohydrate kinase [Paracoccus sp. (in: a-proteobacteria)]|nr:carbohydrate kinase [Paracoccus sp. (in: a-proteobacteria)]
MILCCGESLIDMVPEGDAFRPLPGGAVFNTAIALGRLGAQAGYLWPLSRDRFGQRLAQALDDARVGRELCPATDRPTTLAFVHLSDTGEAQYSFYDEGSAGRMFEPAALPALPEGLEALFIGGISLTQEPCGTAVEELALRAAQAGITVMIDPNIRPAFINHEAETRARIGRLLRLASIVKLSDDDRAWLFPGQDADELAAQMDDSGVRLLLLTGGAQGATAICGAHRHHHPAPEVELADTIGAGDTFNAGLLAALAAQGALSPDRLAALDETGLQAALDLASRAAAVTVSRAGANPPWAHELGL